jgi:hypothetical protein
MKQPRGQRVAGPHLATHGHDRDAQAQQGADTSTPSASSDDQGCCLVGTLGGLNPIGIIALGLNSCHLVAHEDMRPAPLRRARECPRCLLGIRLRSEGHI